jgi:NADH dehydrogenase (ubiquinone) 1 beta subcomplex subunit 5
MAALSCLRFSGRSLLTISLRGSFGSKVALPTITPQNVVVRNMSGHKRTMEIVPSSFEWRKFKDHLNFYAMLGIIPLACIIGATNLLVGPGELIDTPEGYEPKHWEYYKSPISQFFAHYVIDSPEKRYERHMHFVAVEMDKIKMRKLEKKVKLLVGEYGKRYDSKRWYYVPTNDRITQAGREFEQENDSTRGY